MRLTLDQISPETYRISISTTLLVLLWQSTTCGVVTDHHHPPLDSHLFHALRSLGNSKTHEYMEPGVHGTAAENDDDDVLMTVIEGEASQVS